MALAFLTDYKWITSPKPFGLVHLFWVLFLAGLTAVYWSARRRPARTRDRILVFTGLYLLAFEAGKQWFFMSLPGGYDWFVFPLQPCSAAMYALIAAGALREGPLKRHAQAFCAYIGLAFGACGIIYPGALFNENAERLFLLWQSPQHHAVLCAAGIYMFMSGAVTAGRPALARSVRAYLACCAASFAVNVAVHSFAPINALYVGPYTVWEIPLISSLLPLDSLAVFLPVFLGLNILMAFAVQGLALLVSRAVRRRA